MTIYTNVFGGANIYPSEVTYSFLALTVDTVLSWPEETSTNSALATRIIDVTPDAANRSVILPYASKTGTGNTILFNNLGVDTFTVKNADGVQVVTVDPGTLWQVYVTDNTSAAGEWVALQYGASISQANASSLAGTGIVAVGTLLSQSVPITAFNSDYTASTSDRAKMFNWTGAAGTYNLPDATVVGGNWFIYLRNSGSGAINVVPAGLETIDDGLFKSFQPTESAIIACDGSNFYTIGFGQSVEFAFDYTVIDVSGSGTYTLSGSELNRIAYRFSGTLTGNRSIIVPATVQQYWVDNETTGAYLLSIDPYGGGLGVNVSQGERSILYCDGTDVLNAATQGVSYPIAVNQGGTGATTAGAALINLGGGSTGISLFQSITQADAWSVLGVAQAGNVDGGAF
jgi:hypothetical protein